jgi:hypothetical protein
MCGRDKDARAVEVAGPGWPSRGLSDGTFLSGPGSLTFGLVLFPSRSAPRDRASDGSASGGADSVRG